MVESKTEKVRVEYSGKSNAVVAIAGDFNKWVPQNLKENCIELSLLPGYKYRYCFFERPSDRPIVDKGFGKKWSQVQRSLPFGLRESNFLEVGEMAQEISEEQMEDLTVELQAEVDIGALLRRNKQNVDDLHQKTDKNELAETDRKFKDDSTSLRY